MIPQEFPVWPEAFGDRVVFAGYDAVFPAGRVTCLMGPSGVGKTTLLNLVLGLEAPDAGRITGAETLRWSVVFQEDRLTPSLSAGAAVRFAAPKGTPRRAVSELLGSLGLDEAACRGPVAELSGGQRRRVAIARALVADCDALALDEPFKGLDPAAKAQAAAVIRERAQGKTVLLVAHDEAEAALMRAQILHLP